MEPDSTKIHLAFSHLLPFFVSHSSSKPSKKNSQISFSEDLNRVLEFAGYKAIDLDNENVDVVHLWWAILELDQFPALPGRIVDTVRVKAIIDEAMRAIPVRSLAFINPDHYDNEKEKWRKFIYGHQLGVKCFVCGANLNTNGSGVKGPGIAICKTCIDLHIGTSIDPVVAKCSFCGLIKDLRVTSPQFGTDGICEGCIALCQQILLEQ